MAQQTWNVTPSSTTQSGDTQPVSVLLAHREMDRTTTWYQALQLDTRFRVTSMANTAQDLRAKLASSPEVILLDATIFDSPQPLIETLTSISGAVYLIIPGGVTEDLTQQLGSIQSVKRLAVGDINIADFAQHAYGTALALRQATPKIASAAWSQGTQQRSGGVGGLRIVTVWSRSGGTGRTTIAIGLAQAVARRGLKTLLIGLGSPDTIPLQLNLKPEPNILSWMANPTDEGLRTGIQSAGELHVLAGFPDILSEAQGERNSDAPGSVNELVTSAAYSGYSAIILDTPSSGGIAPRALSAANTWLMVAKPTVNDVWTSVEAFRTVTQKIAGQHRITPGNIFVLLNDRTNGQLTADQWHSAADAACRKMGLNLGFPPVMAVIPHSADVSIAADSGRSALEASDEVARPIHRMAEMLFGGVPVPVEAKKEARAVQFGPLKIRMK